MICAHENYYASNYILSQSNYQKNQPSFLPLHRWYSSEMAEQVVGDSTFYSPDRPNSTQVVRRIDRSDASPLRLEIFRSSPDSPPPRGPSHRRRGCPDPAKTYHRCSSLTASVVDLTSRVPSTPSGGSASSPPPTHQPRHHRPRRELEIRRQRSPSPTVVSSRREAIITVAILK